MTAQVVDTSVWVDLLVGPDPELLADNVAAFDCHAPAHLDLEVSAALRGLMLGRHIRRDQMLEAFDDFGELAIRRWPVHSGFGRRALLLAEDMTVYDAAFVVCAEAVGGRLLTRDRKLATAAARHVEVRVV